MRMIDYTPVLGAQHGVQTHDSAGRRYPKEKLYRTAYLNSCGCYVALLDCREYDCGRFRYLCQVAEEYRPVWHDESALSRFGL